jgi:hypothetical protein
MSPFNLPKVNHLPPLDLHCLLESELKTGDFLEQLLRIFNTMIVAHLFKVWYKLQYANANFEVSSQL